MRIYYYYYYFWKNDKTNARCWCFCFTIEIRSRDRRSQPATLLAPNKATWIYIYLLVNYFVRYDRSVVFFPASMLWDARSGKRFAIGSSAKKCYCWMLPILSFRWSMINILWLHTYVKRYAISYYIIQFMIRYNEYHMILITTSYHAPRTAHDATRINDFSTVKYFLNQPSHIYVKI